MAYQTVFDISQKGFDWWFPAAGLAFLAVGIFLIWLGKKKTWTGFQRWTGYYFVAFSSLWTLAAFGTMWPEYTNLHNAYMQGQYSVVEGEVENFRPMPYDGHQDECFSVKGVTFCYSDYGPTAGFNNSTSHGGPIRAGLPVRIAYLGNHILRIDVREDRVPGLAERRATEARAVGKLREREERNPQLDRMNLAFALAAVFMTAWWNLSWQRFMRFWVKPPNRKRTIVGFRVFFALNLLGAIWHFTSQVMRHPRPSRAYLDAFAMGAAWILVIVLMVYFAEWRARTRCRQAAGPPTLS